MSVSRLAFSASALGACLLLCQCAPKPVSYAYDVAVTLTPAATARLNALGETAEVSGYYYGAPTEAVKEKVNEAGQIELGEDLSPVPAAGQTVHMTGKGVDLVVVPKVVDSAVHVLITAYTVRTAADPDPLSCTTFDGLVTAAQARPVAITCDVAR